MSLTLRATALVDNLNSRVVTPPAKRQGTSVPPDRERRGFV
jgi:hypothetical protein